MCVFSHSLRDIDPRDCDLQDGMVKSTIFAREVLSGYDLPIAHKISTIMLVIWNSGQSNEADSVCVAGMERQWIRL
ncbi:hypothetical protein CQZ93_18120 [Ochrobactrum vermis]|nr:hypothetical protein CQZ93_18120 [Ochrobactrum vermis]